ncbi:N-acetyldiaminopimelate deacetylase [Striga asiatica]|uniref:N-acetyldiaminopimelate deacetylase n=1 Tax=Striga asiatica TaxID=4170 RepID=A0A5A7PPT9_STRAF|nr:N-acetyldiaminopimelate deacetylase [Striga asiatica]
MNKTNLNCTMILVMGQAERTEWAVSTVQTVHIAFAFVRVGVVFAVDEELFPEKGLQPRRPPVAVLLVRSSGSLLKNQKIIQIENLAKIVSGQSTNGEEKERRASGGGERERRKWGYLLVGGGSYMYESSEPSSEPEPEDTLNFRFCALELK